MHALSERVAVVTGAARGIGRGIALALADADCHVVVSDLAGAGNVVGYELSGGEQLDATTREVASRGAGRAVAIPCDVTQADQVQALIDKTVAEFGRIDLLVNNAGVVHMSPIETIEEERWDQVYAVNVKGVFLASKAALPALAERQGAIVNISSVAGKRGHPTGSLYCSSKFAVIGMTQSLALEVAGRGVRVNAVCPGILDTAMWSAHLASEERGGAAAYQGAVDSLIPLGREQTPEDIAAAVIYLATAPNVTGIALNVAGGMEVW